jgi:hypothetical protein
VSKKDYQTIASVIYTVKLDALCTTGGAAEQSRDIWLGHVSSRLAAAFAYDNPRFDRARFLEACETGTCKGMAKVQAKGGV